MPFRLNGLAVEVETTITVNFKIGGWFWCGSGREPLRSESRGGLEGTAGSIGFDVVDSG